MTASAVAWTAGPRDRVTAFPLCPPGVLAERLGVEPLIFPGDHQGLALDAAACADIIHAALG
ncbi:hypothetical protein [Microbispora sp. H10830]|uniref:hypothetical protein n=1 Tax=Microbispora sp. H10830 TaxID=2729109 RepID=UPI0016029E6E|nr:hypothetical protein [Microbispora sp. H10830]